LGLYPDVLVAEESRTDNSGIVAQFRDDHFRVLGEHFGVNLIPDLRLERQEKRIALIADTAAYTEDVRLKNVYNIRDTDSEIADITLHDLFPRLITLTQCVE
jgi:hypothetical protein